jgi:hypothetical protein
MGNKTIDVVCDNQSTHKSMNSPMSPGKHVNVLSPRTPTLMTFIILFGTIWREVMCVTPKIGRQKQHEICRKEVTCVLGIVVQGRWLQMV